MNPKAGSGKPRITWTEKYHELNRLKYSECIRTAQERSRRRSYGIHFIKSRRYLVMIRNVCEKLKL